MKSQLTFHWLFIDFLFYWVSHVTYYESGSSHMWYTMSQSQVRDKSDATCGTLWVSDNQIMSHMGTVIQRVIVKGSDNVREEGSPNDKLQDVYQTGSMAVQSWHVRWGRDV